MNWKKFLPGVMGHKDNVHEDETESDEEEITESDETISTDKRHRFLGIPIHKMSQNHLSKRCTKFAFLALNGVTFIAGITAIVTSVWMLADNKIMSLLIGQRLFMTTLLLMGVLTSFVALIGIIGILKRRRKYFSVYIACYSLFLGIIFISAILCFWLFELIIKKVQDDMTTSIGSYHSRTKEAWDNTQRHLKCCGIKSFKDWAKYRMNIPQSCCSRSIDQCFHMTENLSYKSGCLKSAVLLLKSHIRTINISALFVFSILLLSVFLALSIRSKMKRHRSNPN